MAYCGIVIDSSFTNLNVGVYLRMKKIAIAAVAATSIFALSACNNSNNADVVETKAGNITKEEFYEALKESSGQQILTGLVQEKVLEKEYKVSDKEIKDKLEELKATYGQQIDMMIQQQGEEFVNRMVKLEILTQKAGEKAVKVTDKDVKEYYDSLEGKIRASHILVADEKTAKEIKEKLDKGEKFEDLAKEYGTDGTAPNGGDLGWFGKGAMVKEFEDAAFKLKEGEVSGPVKTEHGYHIIKLTETVKPYDQMKKGLTEELKKQKATDGETIQKAIDKAIKDADVKINDKDLKDIFKTEEAAAPAEK